MFDRTALRDLLAKKEIAIRDKLLLVIAVDPDRPKAVKEIREIAISAGMRGIKDTNISSYLMRASSYAARGSDGWELTGDGRVYVAEISGPLLPSVTPLVISSLRNQLARLSNADTRSFVEESIKCFEAKLYRSAIVFSWIGAVSVLHNFVHAKHLADLNSEALRRDSKWRAAKSIDDISRLKEFDFLQIICAISVVGKNVKDELEVCLKLRNGCGHPNSLQVGEHKASAHIETLIQNVYLKF